MLLNPLCFLDKVQSKVIHLINNPNLTNSLQSLSHSHLVADLSICYWYFHGHYSQEIKNTIPDPLRHVWTTRSPTHSYPFQVLLHNPQTISHNLFQEHLHYGAPYLLCPSLIPTICLLSYLTFIIFVSIWKRWYVRLEGRNYKKDYKLRLCIQSYPLVKNFWRAFVILLFLGSGKIKIILY